MITFDDIYHVGIIVPDMEAAMEELGRRFSCRLARPLHCHRPRP